MVASFRRGKALDSPFLAANRVGDVSFTLGTQSGSVLNVALQLLDAGEQALQEVGAVDMWLATAEAGAPLASAPSGGVAIGTHGMLITHVTNVAWKAISDSSGRVDINITNSGAATYYLCVAMPSGNVVVSPAIVIT